MRIRTDFRPAGGIRCSVVKVMVEGSYEVIVRYVDELLQVLKGC